MRGFSRAGLALGLAVSALVHAVFVLGAPSRPAHELETAAAEDPAMEVVPIVETPAAVRDADPPRSSELEPPEPATARAEDRARDRPRPEPTQRPTRPATRPPAPASLEPRLVRTAAPQRSERVERGDFAGAHEGVSGPELRIDWGTPEDAAAALRAGGMVPVVLGGGALVVDQMAIGEDGAWRRQAHLPPATTMFSNRLRIVQDVPAFDGVRGAAGLRPGERLAILVPVAVERMLESAQLQAAFERGLTMERIRRFGGRFTAHAGGLAFEITQVAGGRDPS